jgi:hypothetical protein
MNRFSLQLLNNSLQTNNLNIQPVLNNNIQPVLNKNINYYDENKVFYICSSGGCGSTIIYNYLKKFGKAYHIHDRYPPNKLQYIGKENTNEDVYSEWFNGVEIPEDKLKNYKVIFIYKNPIQVIFSRFISGGNKANTSHLKNIKCNNLKANIEDVLKTGIDLFRLEEFFDNYVVPRERNYNIYCVKYELFWSNISLFNKVMEIPDVKELYPVKIESARRYQYIQRLTKIYGSLIYKMRRMRCIEIVQPIQKEREEREEKEETEE